MSVALRYLLGMPFGVPPDAIPFEVSDRVPLHRIYRPTGAVMAIAGAVMVGGRLHMHPDRLAELKAALANPQPTATEVARWADDGGAAP